MRVSAVRPLGRVMTAMPMSERSVRSILRGLGLRRAIDTVRFSAEEFAWFHALLRDTDTFRNELESGRYPSLRHGLAPELTVSEEVLASIRSPMLLLWGEEDPFGGRDVAQALAERITNAQLQLVADADMRCGSTSRTSPPRRSPGSSLPASRTWRPRRRGPDGRGDAWGRWLADDPW